MYLSTNTYEKNYMPAIYPWLKCFTSIQYTELLIFIIKEFCLACFIFIPMPFEWRYLGSVIL